MRSSEPSFGMFSKRKTKFILPLIGAGVGGDSEGRVLSLSSSLRTENERSPLKFLTNFTRFQYRRTVIEWVRLTCISCGSAFISIICRLLADGHNDISPSSAGPKIFAMVNNK